VFVRDRWMKITVPVSLNELGMSTANRASSQPFLSADGRTIAFQSFASDLVSGDYNDTQDVFVARLSGSDDDGDTMDDDWEMAYFNTLDRNGSADFDSDGQTDEQEFQAGTDPTNAGSILRVLSLTLTSTYPEQGRETTIFWSAAPAKRYQIQFKDDLNNPAWTNLGGIITASGTTASATDTPVPPTIKRRFYRVVLVQ